MLRQCDHLRQLRLVGIRLFEQPQTNLDRENGPHSRLDVSQLKRAILDQSGEVLHVGVAGHVHVEARTQRAEGRFAPVAREALGDEASDGKRVADDEAPKAPLAPQDIAEQEAVPARGDIVEVHVSAHQRPDTGLHGGLEGREVNVAQLALGQVDRIIVTPAVRRAVTREVFGAGHDTIGRPRDGPWNPRTWAAAMAAPRQGSSPAPSTMRPQRVSRAMSSIGPKVQCRPAARASLAATACARSVTAGSHDEARASGTGKIVR